MPEPTVSAGCLRVSLAHMLLLINIIFMLGCQQTIENNTKYLVIPWVFVFVFSLSLDAGIFYALPPVFDIPLSCFPFSIFDFDLALCQKFFVFLLLFCYRFFGFCCCFPLASCQILRVAAVPLCEEAWQGRR